MNSNTSLDFLDSIGSRALLLLEPLSAVISVRAPTPTQRLIFSCAHPELKPYRANNHGDQGTPSNEPVSTSTVLWRPVVTDDVPKAST